MANINVIPYILYTTIMNTFSNILYNNKYKIKENALEYTNDLKNISFSKPAGYDLGYMNNEYQAANDVLKCQQGNVDVKILMEPWINAAKMFCPKDLLFIAPRTESVNIHKVLSAIKKKNIFDNEEDDCFKLYTCNYKYKNDHLEPNDFNNPEKDPKKTNKNYIQDPAPTVEAEIEELRDISPKTIKCVWLLRLTGFMILLMTYLYIHVC